MIYHRTPSPMRYRWTQLETGATGIREKSFESALEEGEHRVTRLSTPALYYALIAFWNLDPRWHYELLP